MPDARSPQPAPSLLAIVGPTASGKSRIAQSIATEVNATLVSVDSRKVYRGLDIGTAKPSPDIRRQFDYAMIDCADPSEYFSAGRYANMARQIVAERMRFGRPVILVGGTGFYLDAFIHGLAELPTIDPSVRAKVLAECKDLGWEAIYERMAAADPSGMNHINPNDKTRIRRAYEVYLQTGHHLSELQANIPRRAAPWPTFVVSLELERVQLHERIANRVHTMVAQGLFEEVGSLLDSGLAPDAPGFATVGYQEALRCIRGEVSQPEAVQLIIQNTRRYAKRQLTWFRHRPYVHQIVADSFAQQRITDAWQGGSTTWHPG